MCDLHRQKPTLPVKKLYSDFRRVSSVSKLKRPPHEKTNIVCVAWLGPVVFVLDWHQWQCFAGLFFKAMTKAESIKDATNQLLQNQSSKIAGIRMKCLLILASVVVSAMGQGPEGVAGLYLNHHYPFSYRLTFEAG